MKPTLNASIYSNPSPVTSLCDHRTTCRLCGGEKLTTILSLAPTPPANAFVSADALNKRQERFPLDVYMCEECGHLQLLDIVDPRVLFEDYVYVSGTSPVFIKHFEDYAHSLTERFHLGRKDLIVDIGSNDGTLLAAFQSRGMTVLGIDPAREIAKTATQSGIETIVGFFTPECARKIKSERGPAAVVTANNVFAHIDDLGSVLDGVRVLLRPDGAFVFEVSYLVDVYEKTLFDTIYHEHLSYHSVKPLRRFFASKDLDVFAVERIDTHGGSLRGMVQRKGGPHQPDGSAERLIALEDGLGLGRVETWRRFEREIGAVKNELQTFLQRAKAEGRSIAGFGAPAKATTLMHHFGIGPGVIDFIVDDSPLKQGLYSPGYHIPVLSPDAVYEHRPDYLLILAWNFAASIMKKHAAFRETGGRFIVPLPNFQVI